MRAMSILAALLQLGCNGRSGRVEGTDVPTVSACPESGRCDRPFCEQVLIPGGPFVMGSDEEPRGEPPEDFRGLDIFGDPRPAHEVLLGPYCIDKYEVTVERYEDCVRAGACDPGEARYSALPGSGVFLTRVNHYPDDCRNRGDLCPTCPVNCRSHAQARDYCRWTGRRLCTEAEWERAASGPGPGKRPFPWGSDPVDPATANIAGVGPGHVLPVGSLPGGASVEGVLDLAGNVYEWVDDVYWEYATPAGSSSDASRERFLWVGRGGCFHTDSGYENWERTTFDPDFDWGCIGIRCCASVVHREGDGGWRAPQGGVER